MSQRDGRPASPAGAVPGKLRTTAARGSWGRAGAGGERVCSFIRDLDYLIVKSVPTPGEREFPFKIPIIAVAVLPAMFIVIGP